MAPRFLENEMNWICIGMLAGSLITSTHETREACEGRAVILREAKASAKCVELPSRPTALWNGGVFTPCANCITIPN
jgi:hypothetical protein